MARAFCIIAAVIALIGLCWCSAPGPVHAACDTSITLTGAGCGPAGAAPPASSGWDPGGAGTQITLTNGTIPNDTAQNTVGSGHASVRSLVSHNTGLKYLELVYTAVSTAGYVAGIADATTTGGAGLDTFVGGFANSGGSFNNNAAGFSNGTFSAPNHFGSAWGPLITGDVMQLAYDFTGDGTSGFVYLGKNCSYLASGDPISGPAGTGNFFSFPVSTPVFAAVSMQGPTDGKFRIVTGPPFNCTLPTGYSAWN